MKQGERIQDVLLRAAQYARDHHVVSCWEAISGVLETDTHREDAVTTEEIRGVFLKAVAYGRNRLYQYRGTAAYNYLLGWFGFVTPEFWLEEDRPPSEIACSCDHGMNRSTKRGLD